MPKQINIQDSLVLHPSDIDTSHSSYSSASNNANAYDDTSSTTYSQISLTTGSRASSYVTYTFDTSALPANVNIDSVACQVKARVSSTSYVSTAELQLYHGSTAMGSSVSYRSTTASTYTVPAGTWTRSQLDNIAIRATATRGTSNTSRSAYIQFYGADLTINYSLSGTAYTITATSSVTGVTVEPSTQDIMAGENGTVKINTNDISDYIVTDNGVDVTESLVREQVETTGTSSAVLGTYSLVSGGFNGSGSTYFQGIVGHGVDATQTSSSYYSSGSGTIAVFTYDMHITDIPSEATITRVYCEVNGHAESTSNSNEYMCVQLISGSTDISDETNFKSIGTNNTTITLEANSIPTISQLASMKLQCRLGYYGGAINGATLHVEYEVPGGDQYYYTYEIINLDDDHVISVDEETAYIPPEEDPQYTYYSLTISSINAITDPPTGTTRVVEGTNHTITIQPTDPKLTLALDNGVDITSQLQGGTPDNTFTIGNVSGASYGFSLNNDGYYESQNAGQSTSAALARVTFNLETECTVTFKYINYAEATYDYGIFGQIDTALGTTYTPDSGAYLSCNTSAYNSASEQQISYVVPAGNHYIDVKFTKDNYTDNNNDSLQFKVELESLEASDYTYTINNINQKHSLIFVFGDVNYYFVTSSGTNCRLFPDGQQVKLQGEQYRIHIVPNNITDTVTLKDNNVTQILEREDGFDKDNNPVVSYSYEILNIQAAHDIVVTATGTVQDHLYIKQNGSWVEVTKLYVKINGSWVEQELSYLSDENIQELIKG